MHLATHPNGAISLCCEASTQGKTLSNNIEAHRPYKLAQDKLVDAVNSENFCQYRREMIAGQWPKPCVTCKNKEAQGQQSKRQRENRRWLPIFSEQELINRSNADGKLNKINFGFIELRLANTCNSACITCNPISSSRWIQDADALQKCLPWYQNFYTSENNWTNNPQIFDEIAEHCSELKEIYINGGEPTLIPQHYALLDRLVGNNSSKNIRLHYSINCTRLPSELVDLWLRFKQVNVSCSIDELAERNNYIRWPTEWGTVLNTINKLRHHANTTIITGITQTVSIFNQHRLTEFESFVKNMWPKMNIYKNYLTEPHYLQANLQDNTKFREFVKAMDQIRQTDFVKTFPELSHLLDE
jgi:organic radical activating enzyme